MYNFFFTLIRKHNILQLWWILIIIIIIIIQALLLTFLPKTTLSTHLGQLNKLDDSVLKRSDFKQIWQTNRNRYYRLPWFTIFPNFLKENKHTETMDSVCCSGTMGMCLISALSLSLTDKLKALSPCGVPASPTQKSLNMSSDWKHVPLFKQAREQSGFGF